MIIQYSDKITGLDGFQVKVLNQKIKSVVNKYNIGFEVKSGCFVFLVFDLNIKICIYYDDIYFNIDSDMDYFDWLCKYVSYVEECLSHKENITYNILSVKEIEYLNHYSLAEYHFIDWDLITTTISLKDSNPNT